jgi:hypothetical protein
MIMMDTHVRQYILAALSVDSISLSSPSAVGMSHKTMTRMLSILLTLFKAISVLWTICHLLSTENESDTSQRIINFGCFKLITNTFAVSGLILLGEKDL